MNAACWKAIYRHIPIIPVSYSIAASQAPVPNHFISMTARLYMLLAFLIEEANKHAPPASHAGVEHVQRACNYIARHYHEPITVNDIASHISICRSRLYRVFMQHLWTLFAPIL